MISMELVCPPESITHLHLLSVIATEIINRNFGKGSKIKILDAGCGNGHLTTFLHINLVSLFKELEFEIYGYDVADHDVQAHDFFSSTCAWCEDQCPEVPWKDRLKLIRHDEKWPFNSCFFDFVISNQVLEHVLDHRHFFGENNRVLKEKGAGVHLFPLKHYIYEGHLLLPFVHRILDWDCLNTYIYFMNKFGFGKYRTESSKTSLEVYSERHADYMTFCTNYLSHSELLSIVKQLRLRPSLKYTSDFYRHKLRQIFKKKYVIELKNSRSGLFWWFVNHFLKYVSCITLFVVKDNIYELQ
jgi:SAM-dependent methyltransferase